MTDQYVNGLHRGIVAIVRSELEREANCNFELVNQLPNSETKGISEFFAELNATERNQLLDHLAYYSTTPCTREMAQARSRIPILGEYLRKRPKYGDTFLMKKPTKSAIKNAFFKRMSALGFEGFEGDRTLFSCRGKIGNNNAVMSCFTSPADLRQFDYRIGEWMRPGLVAELAPLIITTLQPFNPSGTIQYPSPIIPWLSYDYIWSSQGATYDFCWDLMTTDTLDRCMDLFPQILHRLGNMMDQINALTIASS